MRRKGRSARSGHAVIAALTLGLGLSACTTMTGTRPVTPIAIDAGRAAGLISAYRAEHGLRPVRVDSRLMRVAADYARTMGEKDSIGHRIGGSLPRRMAGTGYDWGSVAENLAAGYSSLGDAMAGWKASAGHRRNLLSPTATEIGVAAVAAPENSEHRSYWALILASPRPDRVAAGPFGMELAR